MSSDSSSNVAAAAPASTAAVPDSDPFCCSVWSPLFPSHTIPSRIIPLPKEFISYLLEDSIQIPDQFQPIKSEQFQFAEVSDDDSDEESNFPRTEIDNKLNAETADSKDSLPDRAPFFPDLMSKLEFSLSALGGAVFPRLNTVSPRDAAWIATDRTLRCVSAGDILLLLKSSDRIGEYLSTQQNNNNCNIFLRLSRWSNLISSREFRIFILSKRLIAITQRDSNYYPYLQDKELQYHISDLLEEFIEDLLIKLCTQQSDFIVDLYLDTQEKIWILNIKLLNSFSEFGIMKWEEIQKLSIQAELNPDEYEFEFRIILDRESGEMNIPRAAKTIVNRLPEDGIDLSDSAAIENFVSRVSNMGLTKLDQKESDDDSDEEDQIK